MLTFSSCSTLDKSVNQFGKWLWLQPKPDSSQPQLVADFIRYQGGAVSNFNLASLHLRLSLSLQLFFLPLLPSQKTTGLFLAQANTFIRSPVLQALPPSVSPLLLSQLSLSAVSFHFAYYTFLHSTKKGYSWPWPPSYFYCQTSSDGHLGQPPHSLTYPSSLILKSDLCPPRVSATALGKFSSQLLEPHLHQTL